MTELQLGMVIACNSPFFSQIYSSHCQATRQERKLNKIFKSKPDFGDLTARNMDQLAFLAWRCGSKIWIRKIKILGDGSRCQGSIY